MTHPFQDSLCFLGRTTYASVEKGTMTALVGSHGWIEVACNRGNAAQILGHMIQIGHPVALTTPKVP